MTNEKNVIMLSAKSIYKGFFFLTVSYLQLMYLDMFQTQLSVFFFPFMKSIQYYNLVVNHLLISST